MKQIKYEQFNFYMKVRYPGSGPNIKESTKKVVLNGGISG